MKLELSNSKGLIALATAALTFATPLTGWLISHAEVERRREALAAAQERIGHDYQSLQILKRRPLVDCEEALQLAEEACFSDSP